MICALVARGPPPPAQSPALSDEQIENALVALYRDRTLGLRRALSAEARRSDTLSLDITLLRARLVSLRRLRMQRVAARLDRLWRERLARELPPLVAAQRELAALLGAHSRLLGEVQAGRPVQTRGFQRCVQRLGIDVRSGE